MLGLTVGGMSQYDVFISFKNDDADLAAAVYKFLKENLLEAFWSKVSLPELSKSDYDDAIMNALDNSRHFVVVLSSLEYLEAKWVKRKMRTFHSEIEEGRKEDSNFVIIVTDDIYKIIIESNKKLLPLQYRKWHIIPMSEFSNTLLQYVRN